MDVWQSLNGGGCSGRLVLGETVLDVRGEPGEPPEYELRIGGALVAFTGLTLRLSSTAAPTLRLDYVPTWARRPAETTPPAGTVNPPTGRPLIDVLEDVAGEMAVDFTEPAADAPEPPREFDDVQEGEDAAESCRIVTVPQPAGWYPMPIDRRQVCTGCCMHPGEAPRQKYCGDGSNKDHGHRWKEVRDLSDFDVIRINRVRLSRVKPDGKAVAADPAAEELPF